MSAIELIPDILEMIAAVAALAVTYLMYREVRRKDRDRDE